MHLINHYPNCISGVYYIITLQIAFWDILNCWGIFAYVTNGTIRWMITKAFVLTLSAWNTLPSLLRLNLTTIPYPSHALMILYPGKGGVFMKSHRSSIMEWYVFYKHNTSNDRKECSQSPFLRPHPFLQWRMGNRTSRGSPRGPEGPAGSSSTRKLAADHRSRHKWWPHRDDHPASSSTQSSHPFPCGLWSPAKGMDTRRPSCADPIAMKWCTVKYTAECNCTKK